MVVAEGELWGYYWLQVVFEHLSSCEMVCLSVFVWSAHFLMFAGMETLDPALGETQLEMQEQFLTSSLTVEF